MMVKPGYFVEEIHVKSATANGSGDGRSYASSIACATNTNVWPIPAGTIIQNCYMILDVAVTGSTNIDVGDDDDADGFIDSSLSVTLATPAIYGNNAKVAGAYLRVETAGGTDAADIFVVPTSKYYAAAGKEVKMAVTGTWTAGSFRIVLEGLYLLS